MRIHTGVGHTDNESTQHFGSEKLSQSFLVLWAWFEPLVMESIGSWGRHSTSWATLSPIILICDNTAIHVIMYAHNKVGEGPESQQTCSDVLSAVSLSLCGCTSCHVFGGDVVASDSSSKDMRFEPHQERKKNLWEFFRVQNVVVTRRCAQPPCV